MTTERGCLGTNYREGVEKRERERGTGGVRNCFGGRGEGLCGELGKI